MFLLLIGHVETYEKFQYLSVLLREDSSIIVIPDTPFRQITTMFDQWKKVQILLSAAGEKGVI